MNKRIRIEVKVVSIGNGHQYSHAGHRSSLYIVENTETGERYRYDTHSNRWTKGSTYLVTAEVNPNGHISRPREVKP